MKPVFLISTEDIAEMIARIGAKALEALCIGDVMEDAMGSGTGTVSLVVDSVKSFCINELMPLLQSAGVAIALMFFLWALLDLSTQERLTMEYFIKFFSKLAISVFLVLNTPALATACINTGTSLMNLISSVDLSAGSYSDNPVELIKEAILASNAVSWILMVIEFYIVFAIIWIISLVVCVIVYIVGFSRIFEMYIRAAFMPVALGLIADDGWRGAGGRYIRKFLAICSQGAVLCALGEISNLAMVKCVAVMFSNTTNLMNEGGIISGFVVLIGVAFATISIMFKSIGIINDVFGA